MKPYKMCLTLTALVLFSLAGLANAQVKEYPLISPARLSLALGSNLAWLSHMQYNVPEEFNREVDAGAYAAYSLTSYRDAAGTWKPRLILTASSLYGLNSRGFRTSVGIRLPVFVGGDK